MAVNINVPSQVKTYANLAAFPATGALKTIYIAEDTNKTYRWTGSVYTEISASAAMTWGAIGGTLSNQTDLQNALDAKVPTSRTLTINGVTQDLSANRTFTISTGITIGSTAIASGSVGRILFEGAGNVVQESSSLFWDATNNRLGIGTSTPAAIINSVGSVTASSAIARGNFLDNTLVASANNDTTIGLDINSTFINGAFTGVSNLLLRASIAGTTKASITKDGDIILNGVTGANSPAISVFTSGTSAYFQNYYNPTDNALYWQSVGSYHNATKMVFRNFQQNTGFVVFSNGNTAFGGNPATTTDAGFRLDVNGTARVQNDVLLTTGILATSAGTTRLQSVLNFFSHNRLGSSGTFGWDIRTVGTQNSFWRYNTSSGNTEFGSNSYGVEFYGANTLRTTMTSGGNWLINTTTDAGFRLDVNGTARVQGNTNISGFLSATNYLECRSSIFLRNSSGGGNTSFTTDTTNCYLVNSATVDLQIGYLSNYTFRLNNASRSIGIQDNQAGAATTDASALLTLTSTTKGFLPPRMTTTQKNAIASPAAGLMVYDTTLNVISYYNGSMWI